MDTLHEYICGTLAAAGEVVAKGVAASGVAAEAKAEAGCSQIQAVWESCQPMIIIPWLGHCLSSDT